MTLRSHQVIHHHCTIRGIMVEEIGLLTVRPGNAICVVGMAMKQEIVNALCQGQEDRAKMVTLSCEIRLVLDV